MAVLPQHRIPEGFRGPGGAGPGPHGPGPVGTLPGMTTDQQISATTSVDAPASAVFRILSDPRQHSRIDGSGSVGAAIEGPDRLTATGQRFTVRMRMFGLPYTMRNVVAEFEQDRRIAWHTAIPVRWRYELEPTGDGGTRVTETFDYSRVNPVQAAVLRLSGMPARNLKGITQTLVRLKAAAEADSRSATAG